MSVKVPQSKTYETYVNVLPKEVQSRAWKIVEKVKPTLDISDRIIYQDGTLGSNIVDLLRYSLGLSKGRPPDYSKFEGRLEESGKKWMHLLD